MEGADGLGDEDGVDGVDSEEISAGEGGAVGLDSAGGEGSLIIHKVVSLEPFQKRI